MFRDPPFFIYIRIQEKKKIYSEYNISDLSLSQRRLVHLVVTKIRNINNYYYEAW